MMSDTFSKPYGFTRRPEPKTIGSPSRGQQLIDGQTRLVGGMVEGDPFTSPSPSPEFTAALQGFGWLDDLAAVAHPLARDLAQKRVLEWIERHSRIPAAAPIPRQSPEWQPDITGRRVLRWIFHAGLILPGLDRDGAQPFFDSLHAQLGYLGQNWGRAAAGLPRIETLTALCEGAIYLNGAEKLIEPALSALGSEAEQIMADGLLRSRNPEELLNSFALLVWVQESAAEAGHAVPDALPRIIEATAPILRSLRHADGSLPRFHGGGRGVPGRLDHSLRAATGPAVTAPGLAMGYARMARARTTVIMDAASPPSGAAAGFGHASTLAFELTVARDPFIVSCGSGQMFGQAWARASRATPCHSTLCLSGLSSSRLSPADEDGAERLTLPPRHVWAGDCDQDGNLLPPNSDTSALGMPAHLMAGHDGWVASHGLSHVRELWLSSSGDHFKGEDTLAALDDAAQAKLEGLWDDHPNGIAFDIRFHLHPEIRIRRDDEILHLTLPNGEIWIFTHDQVANMLLEPSAYLESGNPDPRPSQQIVLKQRLNSYALQIGWTFARAGVR